MSEKEKEKPSIGLGDVVRFNWEGGYHDGTVCKIHANGSVDVFRPYVQAADFSCSGGEVGSLAVICYIGSETVKEMDPSRLKLVQKSIPLR